MFCSFLYSLTYCIKEVIKGKIFWRLNEKILVYEAATAWNRRLLQFFQNNDPIVFVLFISISFDLLYQRGYQRQYFWTITLKVLAHEAPTALNRGITCKILKSLIKLYLFCLLFYFFYVLYKKRLSEAITFEIKWIYWTMRQIQSETGESLVFFLNTNPIVFFFPFILWLTVSKRV